jgi:hypothetical protein
VGGQCVNRDVVVEVARLEDDAFGLLAPLSSAKISEPDKGEPPDPPLPQVVIHLR